MIDNAKQLKNYWEKGYLNSNTQFDVDQPDSWIAGLEQTGQIKGTILDAGCGPGRTARYLAELGHDVLGIDISVNAVERAKEKATKENNSARFLQADICRLTGYDREFDTVVDIGCFHSLPEADRGLYSSTLHRMCRADAAVFIRAFSEKNKQSREDYTESNGLPLPAIREEHIRNAFSDGWKIDAMEEREIDLLVADGKIKKSYCGFAIINRA